MVPPSKGHALDAVPDFEVINSLIDSSTSADDLNDRTLPPEITGDIIGQLRNQRDILSCSLVSWGWLSMSRKCLHIHLHSDRIHQFHELINSPTNTISAIRTVEIADLQMPQLLSLLPCFLSLRTLSLSFWFALTEDFSDMPRITRLHLRAIVFTTFSRFCGFIAKFPALKDLSLSDVTWERVESNQTLVPNFDFESLHLHSGHRFAPEAFVFATTRHFSLDFPQDTISSDLSQLVSLYLGSLGGPLRHLELNCCENFDPDFSATTGIEVLHIRRALCFSFDPLLGVYDLTFHPNLATLLNRISPHSSLHELTLDVFTYTSPPMGWESFPRLTEILSSQDMGTIRTVEFRIFAVSLHKECAPVVRGALGSRAAHRSGWHEPDGLYVAERYALL